MPDPANAIIAWYNERCPVGGEYCHVYQEPYERLVVEYVPHHYLFVRYSNHEGVWASPDDEGIYRPHALHHWGRSDDPKWCSDFLAEVARRPPAANRVEWKIQEVV